MAPNIVLEPVAAAQVSVLSNLFELYVHDFSEQVAVELKPNGRFELPIHERWFNSADHFPFFIQSDGKLLGFALVRRGSRVTNVPDVMDVAEFFVVRGARRRGVGASAAQALFTQFPGRWEIRVRMSNPAAQRFWHGVAQSWLGHAPTARAFTEAGVAWELLELPRRPA